MREPTEEEIHIKSRLLYLYDLYCQNHLDWDGERIKEYIDVGEWSLAADTLAFLYLPGQFEITETIFNILADLAKRMGLVGDEWHPHITKLVSQKFS